MKKNQIVFAVILLTVLIGNSSCSDEFLELEPKINKLESNSYKTETDAFLALTTVYDALHVQNWMFVPINSDIFSDDAYAAGEPGGGMQQWQDQEISIIDPENSASSDLWNRCYSGIYRANLYFLKEQEIDWNSEEKQKRMRAEALVLRSYFYWDLARHFGWVPVITELLADVEAYKSIPQSNLEEVYGQIVRDLIAAIPDLPETVPASENGRITKDVARVLMARVFMFYDDFVKPVMGASTDLSDGSTTLTETYVQNVLDTIIQSGRYRLLDNYADVFDWGNENNEESIFEWQYSEQAQSSDWDGWDVDGNFSVVFYGIRNPNGDDEIQSGWSFATTSWSLVDEFEPDDPRIYSTVYNANDSLVSYTRGFQNTGYFSYKYMPRAAFDPTLSGGVKDQNWPVNYKDMRLAEVLLMASELFMDDDPAKALDYLNQVRTRSLGNQNALSSITLDDIYHEKRVELAMEGHRKWDLLRRGLDYAKEKIDATWDVPPEAESPDEFTGRQFDKQTWGMLPIPASEIRLAEEGTLKQYVPAFQ